MSFTPQATVATAPAIALAGMDADCGFGDKISRTLTAACLPGLLVCGDNLTAEPPDASGDVTGHTLGIVLYDASRVPGTTIPDGDAIGIKRTGRVWATLLTGAVPVDGAAVYVYRGATAADRGKVTEDSGAGSVTRVEGCKFTGNVETGLAEVQLDGGSASNGLATVASELASTANGQGASLVGVEDAGLYTTNADVESILAELLLNSYSVQRDITVPSFPTGGILAAGTPLAAWANDAGASSPGVTLSDSKAVCVRWNNFATQTAVWYKAHFPQNIDDAADIVMHFLVSKTGATLGDATKVTVTAFVQNPTTLHDADADFGGDSDAVVGNAATKTVTELTLTLANAQIPVAPFCISFSIKPKDGTLGADDFHIHDVWFEIKSKKVAS